MLSLPIRANYYICTLSLPCTLSISLSLASEVPHSRMSPAHTYITHTHTRHTERPHSPTHRHVFTSRIELLAARDAWCTKLGKTSIKSAARRHLREHTRKDRQSTRECARAKCTQRRRGRATSRRHGTHRTVPTFQPSTSLLVGAATAPTARLGGQACERAASSPRMVVGCSVCAHELATSLSPIRSHSLFRTQKVVSNSGFQTGPTIPSCKNGLGAHRAFAAAHRVRVSVSSALPLLFFPFLRFVMPCFERTSRVPLRRGPDSPSRQQSPSLGNTLQLRRRHNRESRNNPPEYGGSQSPSSRPSPSRWPCTHPPCQC